MKYAILLFALCTSVVSGEGSRLLPTEEAVREKLARQYAEMQKADPRFAPDGPLFKQMETYVQANSRWIFAVAQNVSDFNPYMLARDVVAGRNASKNDGSNEALAVNRQLYEQNAALKNIAAMPTYEQALEVVKKATPGEGALNAKGNPRNKFVVGWKAAGELDSNEDILRSRFEKTLDVFLDMYPEYKIDSNRKGLLAEVLREAEWQKLLAENPASTLRFAHEEVELRLKKQ